MTDKSSKTEEERTKKRDDEKPFYKKIVQTVKKFLKFEQ